MSEKITYKKFNDKFKAYNSIRESLNPQDLEAKFKVKSQISYNESCPSITAKGPGFELLLSFQNTELELDLNLSLLLRPLKSKILGTIVKEFSQVL